MAAHALPLSIESKAPPLAEASANTILKQAPGRALDAARGPKSGVERLSVVKFNEFNSLAAHF